MNTEEYLSHKFNNPMIIDSRNDCAAKIVKRLPKSRFVINCFMDSKIKEGDILIANTGKRDAIFVVRDAEIGRFDDDCIRYRLDCSKMKIPRIVADIYTHFDLNY